LYSATQPGGNYISIFLFNAAEQIKKWWIWGYWLSPLMYGQNAIVVNEFLGHSWSHVKFLELAIYIFAPLVLNNELISEIVFEITDSWNLHRTTRNPSFEESRIFH
jgi:hypothetical protein